MSLLKEGDGVNFQRASCTLDGCVKIYTNRVDSVATETGKLLSGLADGNSKKRQGNGGEDGDADEDEDGEEEGEDGVKKRPKKRASSEAEHIPDHRLTLL
jgi:condensin complex subunit 2